MKASNLRIVLIGILLSFAFLSVYYSWRLHCSNDCLFGDFTARYNEILCSHDGVDPFEVWSHQINSDKYQGLPRPDMPSAVDSRRKIVHAYPAWHILFFWWYPYVPQSVLQCGYFLLNAIIFLFAPWCILCNSTAHGADKVLSCCFALFACSYEEGRLLYYGNYSGLCLLMFLLMTMALKKQKIFLASIAWAIMMIKPQVGALFFWPLVFQRKYKMIVGTVGACFLGVLFAAKVYNSHPLELIAHIPLIGAPYMGGWPIQKFLQKIINVEYVSPVIMIICFLLCGILSYGLKSSESWLIRCLGVFLLFPYWTYSQSYDMIMLLCFYSSVSLLLLKLSNDDGFKKYKWFFAAYIGLVLSATLFKNVWNVGAFYYNIFNVTGMGWMYHLASLGMFVINSVVVGMIMHNIKKINSFKMLLP